MKNTVSIQTESSSMASSLKPKDFDAVIAIMQDEIKSL